ncbi:alanine racemase [Salipaludibacillus sp. CUR1]|uniref:alanine racemase n=1 Tax=Salipaludibacillus sp. CUR1 TaxID=2820003 RepID=UPI001E5D05E5|nr:alanine racemase [Salipaludibacillus sp. CUR1]
MFLDKVRELNPGLAETGAAMHQNGTIPPNTYVIDLDMLASNVRSLASDAEKNNLELYFMSKQIGRLPQIARWIRDNGIEKAVAVEFNEGKILHEAGIKIGNIGHLVQPGKHEWEEVLRWKPEVVTLFSVARAKQLSEAALKAHMCQPVILRVIDEGDIVFPGQEGGFQLKGLRDELKELITLEGIEVVGVTSFPNFMLNDEQTGFSPTHNFQTLLKAKALLEQEGVKVRHVNGPSATCSETTPILEGHGVTHGEPGHALTGTTPLHSKVTLPEKPAMIYVSEVSHEDKEHAYVIGGGFYVRGQVTGAFVGSRPETIFDNRLDAVPPSLENIDYYGMLKKNSESERLTGQSVVYSFRTQIFVTRANVALVAGIQSGTPRLYHLERSR